MRGIHKIVSDLKEKKAEGWKSNKSLQNIVKRYHRASRKAAKLQLQSSN